MKKIILVLILLFGSVAAFSQENPHASGWVRVESQKKDLSFLIPEGFFVYNDRKNERVTLSSYRDKVSINVSLNRMGNAKSFLKNLGSDFDDQTYKFEKFDTEKVIGRIYTHETSGKYSKSIYLASDKGYYTIFAVAPASQSEALSKLFNSILLNGSPMFPPNNAPNNANATGTEAVLTANSLVSSPIVQKYLEMPDNVNIRLVPYQKNAEKKVFEPGTIYSRPVIILRNVPPAYPAEIRDQGISGRVRLRATFLPGGRIEEAQVVSTPHPGLVASALNALKGVKFLPAQIDGKDVETSKVIEYNFYIY